MRGIATCGGRRLIRGGHVLEHGEYRALRYFKPLDGLRAVSVLLVLTWHVNSTLWRWASGFQGVAVFFVISGYLITTLCLREQDEYGRVSLAAFYLRRACRIFPLYFIVLAIYTVMFAGLDWNGHRHAMVKSLPWYLTYMNDFSPYIYDAATPFTLSWSLGVEEKFYLLWPLLAFVVWRSAPRLRVAAVAILVLVPFTGVDSHDRYLHYSQILVGCLLAVGLHNQRSFGYLRALARHPWPVLALAVGVHLLYAHDPSMVKPVYAPVIGVLLLTLIVGRAGWISALASRPMVFIGKRAYGIYLVQMLCLGVCLHVVGALMPGVAYNALDEPMGNGAWAASLLLFGLGTLASLAVADLLHRTVERPLIARGRTLTRTLTGHRPVAPPRMADGVAGGEPQAPERPASAVA